MYQVSGKIDTDRIKQAGLINCPLCNKLITISKFGVKGHMMAHKRKDKISLEEQRRVEKLMLPHLRYEIKY